MMDRAAAVEEIIVVVRASGDVPHPAIFRVRAIIMLTGSIVAIGSAAIVMAGVERRRMASL